MDVTAEIEEKYCLALKMGVGLTNKDIITLVDAFGSPGKIFEAESKDLAAVLKGRGKLAERIASFRNWETIEREGEKVRNYNAKIVTYWDDAFPSLLKNIHDCPAFLYVRGNLEPEEINIALVGSRRASSYGLLTTENFSRDLSLAGFTVVSGLARGIDAAAHRGALAMKGRTIAVLGSGLDVIYPPEHQKLYEAIVESGAVISEFPFGTPPRACNFPYRNRLISGMSWGVVIVEASEKSGSLITARLAAEQGRTVFAVPGEIHSPLSRGTHWLLREGATLVEKAEDIIEELKPQVTVKIRKEKQDITPHEGLTGKERQILSLIGTNPVHGDVLIQNSGLPAGEVMGSLLTLELKGLIRQLPGKYYRRAE